jgi:hypothetical protein
MKKLISTLLLVTGAYFAQAQTFQWTTNDSVEENLALNTTVQFPLHMVAVGSDTVTLGIEVIYNDIPQTWDGMLCIYGLCMGTIPNVGITAEMDPIWGTQEGMVRLTVNPLNGTEVAKLQVYVYDVDFPNDGDTATFLLNTTLGVEEVSLENETDLYPNPSENWVYVNASYAIERIQLFDLNGSLLLSSELNKINIESLPVGVYVLDIQTDKGNVRKRITRK